MIEGAVSETAISAKVSRLLAPEFGKSDEMNRIRSAEKNGRQKLDRI